MLRDLSALTTNGLGICGTPLVGVLASQIPSGYSQPSLLANDVDLASDPPGTLYRTEILSWPSAGTLVVQENGAFSFTGAPDGAYTASEKVSKFGPASGLISSAITALSLTIGQPAPTVTSVVVSPATAIGSTRFSAQVNGPNSPSQAVTFAANIGTIDSSGNFTAPAATSSIQIATITATSVADTSKSGTATVTIAAAVVVPPPPPPVITNPAMTGAVSFSSVTSTGAHASWTAATPGSNPLGGYQVSLDTGTAVWTDLGNVLADDLSGLLAQSTQTFRVRAFDTAVPRNYSEEISAELVTLAVQAPPPPPPPPVPTIKGTLVEMHFFTPDQLPLANTPVDVQLTSADYNTLIDGIAMPRLLTGTTDADGKVSFDLIPCNQLYYVTVYDGQSEAGLSYKFLVPTLPVGQFARLQDIVVDAALSLTFDQTALLTIVAAKAEAVAAATQAEQLIAALSGPTGATMIGYGTKTVADALNAGTGGGTGTGGTESPGPTSASGNRPEVLITADANGVLTPDGNLSNRFRFELTANTKLANPVNFANNEHIYLTGYQDIAGGHIMTYGLSYMLPGGLPYLPPQNGGATFLIELRPTENPFTNALNWALLGFPDGKAMNNGMTLVTKMATIGGTDYFTMLSAMANILDGQELIVERNGLSSEVTGTLIGNDPSQIFSIVGRPVLTNGADQRPVLKLGTTDYGEGPPRGANRPAYGKALLNFEGKGTVHVRDIRIGDVRSDDMTARGICHNADDISLVLNNVEITNTCNGMLTGNATMLGNTTMTDVLINLCSVGGVDTTGFNTTGYTHSVYFGHNNTTVRMLRTTLSNPIAGDNLKCRTGNLFLDQVLCRGTQGGRELEMPNGGWLEANNCMFYKDNNVGTGSMILVGGNNGAANTDEGLDTTRPRKYKFTNCHFKSDYIVGGGKDGYLVCNLDPNVPLEFVDCLFEGSATSNNSNDPNNENIYAGTVTVNGIRYMPSAPPVFTLTGGPLGPLLPVGYQPVPMTPIV